MVPTRKAMEDAGISSSDITKVLMVGGSSRIPAVQEAVRKYLGKEPHRGINLMSVYLLVLLSRVVFSPVMRPTPRT